MGFVDLYGANFPSLDLVRIRIEKLLNIDFIARESSYLGGDYFLSGDMNSEHVFIRLNFDLLDGEPAEMEFPEYKFLVYVENVKNREHTKSKLSTDNRLHFLRGKDFPGH